MPRLKQLLAKFMVTTLLLPRWVRWLALATAIFLAIYLAWCRFVPQLPAPGSVIQAAESPKIAGMERKTMPAKVQVVADRSTALKRLRLPVPDMLAGELLQAVDTPPTRYGSTNVTFLNVSTGRITATTIIKPAPWFALERGNYAGGGIGLSSMDGTVYHGYYRRDLLQIKGVYLQITPVELIARPNSRETKGEYLGWLDFEKRW